MVVLRGRGTFLRKVVRRRDAGFWLKGMGFVGGAVVVVGLVLALLPGLTVEPAYSYLGREESLGGFDSYLKVSVVGARIAQSLGSETAPLRARGTFYLVTVNVRNAATEGFSVDPTSLDLYVLDADGRTYKPLEVRVGEERYAAEFSSEVGAGENHRQSFLFDLPDGVERPELWVTDPSWISLFLPGNRNSILFQKLVFALEF